MTVRITITPEARKHLDQLAADTRERLERMLGRKVETSPHKMGTVQVQSDIPRRPFLRAALDEARPAIEEKLKAALKATLAETTE